MATKKKAEVKAVEPEITEVVESDLDCDVDLPVSDEVEIDDGDLEDEEFYEETTDEDEEVTEDD